MIISPRFDPKDFERERSMQLAGLLQGPDNVSWLARRALPIVMFGPDHPYGKPAGRLSGIGEEPDPGGREGFPRKQASAPRGPP